MSGIFARYGEVSSVRHNLGPESEAWARGIESRLRALEAPRPETSEPSSAPSRQIWFRELRVKMDYTTTPENTGVSPILSLPRPKWAKYALPLRFDMHSGHLDDGYINLNTFRLVGFTPERPTGTRLWFEGKPLRRYDMGDSDILNLQIRDTFQPSPPSVINNGVSLALLWVPHET